MQTRIPCVLMRGGTSKGPFFLASDLPSDTKTRDRVLLAAMGSPDPMQIDGVGGGHPVTSKVAIIRRSDDPRADVDYLFAQVAINRQIVDTSPNCGNMLAAVGPFAIETGLVDAAQGQTRVRIYNCNTGGLIEATVQTPDGKVEYEGDASIDGVPGTAAPIGLNFLESTDSQGAIFPTGQRREEIDGLPVTLISYTMPMMLVAASSVGMVGNESAEIFNKNSALLEQLEHVRRIAGLRMGLGDVTDKVVPKIAIVSPPGSGSITSRYFIPALCSKTHAVTGTVCVAAAAQISGTVARDVAREVTDRIFILEHPSGQNSVEIDVVDSVNDVLPVVRRAAILRTARRLFEGNLLVPASVWQGRR